MQPGQEPARAEKGEELDGLQKVREIEITVAASGASSRHT